MRCFFRLSTCWFELVRSSHSRDLCPAVPKALFLLVDSSDTSTVVMIELLLLGLHFAAHGGRCSVPPTRLFKRGNSGSLFPLHSLKQYTVMKMERGPGRPFCFCKRGVMKAIQWRCHFQVHSPQSKSPQVSIRKTIGRWELACVSTTARDCFRRWQAVKATRLLKMCGFKVDIHLMCLGHFKRREPRKVEVLIARCRDGLKNKTTWSVLGMQQEFQKVAWRGPGVLLMSFSNYSNVSTELYGTPGTGKTTNCILDSVEQLGLFGCIILYLEDVQSLHAELCQLARSTA